MRTGQVPKVADWWVVERDDQGSVYHLRLMDCLQRNVERYQTREPARYALLGLWAFEEDAMAHVRDLKRKAKEHHETGSGQEDPEGNPERRE